MPIKGEFITSYAPEALGHKAEPVKTDRKGKAEVLPIAGGYNAKMVPIGDITPYENNPRHNENAVDAVAASIREFGWRAPIVVDADMVIVCGHTRLKAAQKLGLSEVLVHIADNLTPEQVQAYRLADNKTAELAEWDMELLAAEFEKLAGIFDMEDFGFDMSEFDTAEEPEVVEDDGEPENVAAICKHGQVWKLGEHRLMCGDSTKPEDVSKLMQGEKADLWLTDPPYNVAYEGNNGMTIKNDSMEDSQFRAFLVDAFSTAMEHLKPGGAFYIWHADSEGFNFRVAAKEAGLQVRQCLVWNKNSLVLGRQDYQWKHEPCLYGWKEGAGHYFTNDRTLTTVIDEDKPARSDDHPTMKPIKLFSRLITNSSRPGEVVLDTFGGSGTTIMAAEQLHRKARMMELDEHYCDVIIARWEKFTGQQAELIAE